jgi:glycosyltransferase involved in cell wall biosynthesis
MNTKISVVTASYLGDYENSATDRVKKFHRAVESFFNQSYDNKELVVVSDGCQHTAIEISKYNSEKIKLIQLEKQELFSGSVRNTGCFMATGDVICYLDTDDFFGFNHLNNIANAFHQDNSLGWVYFNDHIIYRFNPITNEVLAKAEREVDLFAGMIGTSSIAHINHPSINWLDCNEYGHDWTFVKTKLIDTDLKFKKIEGCDYNVCHIPTQIDN